MYTEDAWGCGSISEAGIANWSSGVLYYDDTTETGEVAGSGGTWSQEIDTRILCDNANVQFLEITMTSGASDDTDLELWDEDPSGSGVQIY